MADGDYICFIDADDTIESTNIPDVSNYMSYDIIRCNGWNMYGEIRNPFPEAFIGEMASEEALIRIMNGEMRCSMWGIFFRRSMLDEKCFDLNRRFKMGEDFIFNIRAYKRTKRSINIDAQLYRYNISNSQSATAVQIWGIDYIRDINDIIYAELAEMSDVLGWYADRHRFKDYVEVLHFPEIPFRKDIHIAISSLLVSHPEFIDALPKSRTMFLHNEYLFRIWLWLFRNVKYLLKGKAKRQVLN